MMSELHFDATSVEPSVGFEALPAGKYAVEVTASEMKPTKRGDGSYLELEMTVLEGKEKGRKLWERLNLNNPNPTAVEIARRNLSALCHAIGVLKVEDSFQLHHRPMVVRLTCKKNDQGEMSNEVKAFYPYEESTPSADDATPPWAR
jgi:hypothetical protein